MIGFLAHDGVITRERERQQRTREVGMQAHATYTALTTTNTLMRTCRRRRYCCARRRLRRNRSEIFFCVAMSRMKSHNPALRTMNIFDVFGIADWRGSVEKTKFRVEKNKVLY